MEVQPSQDVAEVPAPAVAKPLRVKNSFWGQAPKSAVGRQQERLGWLLIFPSVLVVLAVAVYPLIMSFRWSFTNFRASRPDSWKYVGFDNYRNLFEDEVFLKAISNTVKFTLVAVTLETILGMVIALAIHSNFRGRGLVRTSMLVPWAIPTVVSSLLWTWMLNDNYGIINALLVNFGFDSFQGFPWTVRPSTALWSVVAVDVWKTTPFMALLILAGLQIIPSDVYEASTVDGASKWQQFWQMTLPLLKPTLVVALIFRTMATFMVFDMIFVIQGTATKTISLAVFTFQEVSAKQRIGYGSASAVIIFLCIAVMVLGYARLLKLEDD